MLHVEPSRRGGLPIKHSSSAFERQIKWRREESKAVVSSDVSSENLLLQSPSLQRHPSGSITHHPPASLLIKFTPTQFFAVAFFSVGLHRS